MRVTDWKKEIGWHILVVALVALNMLLSGLAIGFGNIFIDDFQAGYMPTYTYIGESLNAGRFPLIANTLWNGGYLSGEFQFSIFSLFALFMFWLIAALKLSFASGAMTLAIAHSAVLATGTFALARYFKLPVWLSIVAAWTATFNGYLFGFGTCDWFAMVTSFAWFPWAWVSLLWALEKEDYSRAWLPAIFVYLVITGGWPPAIMLLAGLLLWIVVEKLIVGENKKVIYISAAVWLWGMVLALPSICFIFDHFKHSIRQGIAVDIWNWLVPVTALGGLFTPTHQAGWTIFSGIYQVNHCAELFSNIVTPTLLVTALIFRCGPTFSKYKSEMALLLLSLLICMIPIFNPFRWSFRWLIFFHLTLGLVSARVWLSYLEEKAASPLENTIIAFLNRFKKSADIVKFRWVATAAVYLIIWVGCAVLEKLWNPEPHARRLAYLYVFGVAGFGWFAISYLVRPARLPFAVLLIALITGFFGQNFELSFKKVIMWKDETANVRKVEPFNADRTYWLLYSCNDIFGDYVDIANTEDRKVIRLSNYPMYSGIHAINGCTPIGHEGIGRLIPFEWTGHLDMEDIRRVLDYELPEGRLLSQIGVDGIAVRKELIKDEAAFSRNGWKKVHETPMMVIYESHNPPAFAHSITEGIFIKDFAKYIKTLRADSQGLWQDIPTLSIPRRNIPGITDVKQPAFDKAVLGDFKRDRFDDAISVRVDTTANAKPSLVVIHRATYPGHRLFFNGSEVEMIKLNGSMPAAIIQPGEKGKLELRFEPWYWLPSLSLAIAAAIGAIMSALRYFLRRKAPQAS